MVEPLAFLFMSAAGLATALGALPVVAVREMGHWAHDTLLGFAAGIMLGISAFGLLPHGAGHLSDGGLPLVGSILAGGAFMVLLMRASRRLPLPMPFVRARGTAAPGAAVLIFLAIAIHHAPEGLATGVGYAEGVTPLGNAIAIEVALQNIPEGFLVGLFVYGETRSHSAAIGYAALSGLIEPMAGLIALVTLTVTPQAVGLASGFAVGAMWSVVAFQMVPESHRHGYHVPATAALALGLTAAAVIQVLLGILGI